MDMAFWFFVAYVIGGAIYFCIASYCEERKAHKKAEQKLEQAKQELAQTKLSLAEAQKTVEECDDYIQDLENEKGELRTDYSVMAMMLEEHTTLIADLQKHTEEHCGQLAQLGNIHIRIINGAQPDYSYCGPDEQENDADPYPEPAEQTPLPEWIKNVNVEGLDEI